MRAAFPVPTFDQRRQELEDLGFDCVEWHQGHEAELVDSGIVPLEDIDVIVARFARRPDKDD
jgi:3-keto-L-gulonate-6-phosphate decarboxylase